MLLNRAPAPVETYNDIDGDVVNFFKVLREDPEGLTRAIALTPFSREEFYVAVTGSERNVSRLERARRFYVRARQVRTGLAQTATLGRWANCKNTSRAGMSGVISRWFGGIDQRQHDAGLLVGIEVGAVQGHHDGGSRADDVGHPAGEDVVDVDLRVPESGGAGGPVGRLPRPRRGHAQYRRASHFG